MNKYELARLFHDTYESLAPAFGYETRKETRTFDPTSDNGRLMIAVCGRIGKRIHREGFWLGVGVGAACTVLLSTTASALLFAQPYLPQYVPTSSVTIDLTHHDALGRVQHAQVPVNTLRYDVGYLGLPNVIYADYTSDSLGCNGFEF